MWVVYEQGINAPFDDGRDLGYRAVDPGCFSPGVKSRRGDEQGRLLARQLSVSCSTLICLKASSSIWSRGLVAWLALTARL